jgi:hypothetical protein
MACAHNTFIQGINAMVYHAHRIQENQVQDFMLFSFSLVGFVLRNHRNYLNTTALQVGMIHHHHALEEEFLFPELEKKLGKGALHGNIDQHTEFAPQLHDLEEYIKAVQNGKQHYNGDDFAEKINSFSDVLTQHLADVYFLPLASSAEG